MITEIIKEIEEYRFEIESNNYSAELEQIELSDYIIIYSINLKSDYDFDYETNQSHLDSAEITITELEVWNLDNQIIFTESEEQQIIEAIEGSIYAEL